LLLENKLMGKKYTHLFFDLDNTLWDFKTNSKYAMRATFTALSLGEYKIDFDRFFQIYSLHNANLWIAYRKRQVSKKDLIRQRFQLTFEACGIKDTDPLMANELYLQEMPRQSHLVEGAKEVLNQLRTKGYKLYIITNGFKEVQHAKLLKAGLDGYFEKLFISEEVKVPKPGWEIFEYAIKSSNAKKKSSLMIGDDWDVDICGALNFGIDAVYLAKDGSSSKMDLSAEKSDVRTIQHLNQLMDFL